MKKKKILFVMESLNIGGAEKSLLTILSMIDYKKYDVDLFLFEQKGEFINMIPKNVNILQESPKYKKFQKNRKLAPIKFLLSLDIKSSFNSFLWLGGALISKIKNEKLYIGWKWIKCLFNNIDEEYDTAIAFLERKSIYFTVDKVKAINKIGFIHNDYSIYPYDEKLDRKYFNYLKKIVTVSEHCKDVLIKKFPEYKNKYVVIKNMVSNELINKLSKEKITNYKIDKNYKNLVSVGRLVKQKGFDIAIDICKELVSKNYKIHWYIIGDGEEKKNLNELIKKNHLENNLFLVGADTNPYKWINIADIYVQPSRFEGYGITVAEAKVLNKIIVASNIPEFKELLGNRNGILAKNKKEFVSIIEDIIKQQSIIKKIKMKKEIDDTSELQKLYEII